jgi:hypothetical protein
MTRFLASFSCALFLCAFSLCQVSSSVSTGPNGVHGTMNFYPPNHRVTAIAGAPYSADTIDEHVQTLEDGTHVAQTFPTTKVYRDSMGRTRTERSAMRGAMERRANRPESPIVVEITDPVAHLRYVFTLDQPVAHRQELPETSRNNLPQRQTVHAVTSEGTGIAVASGVDDSEAPAAPTARAAAPSTGARRGVGDDSRPQSTMEDLGTQVIEGIQTEGKRHTLTWPVGSMGNDRPITHILETWISPELKEVILRKSDDPRSGEHTHKLVNIDRSEPDPSLFEPPAGYTVKDETGEFTIEWSAAR